MTMVNSVTKWGSNVPKGYGFLGAVCVEDAHSFGKGRERKAAVRSLGRAVERAYCWPWNR